MNALSFEAFSAFLVFSRAFLQLFRHNCCAHSPFSILHSLIRVCCLILLSQLVDTDRSLVICFSLPVVSYILILLRAHTSFSRSFSRFSLSRCLSRSLSHSHSHSHTLDLLLSYSLHSLTLVLFLTLAVFLALSPSLFLPSLFLSVQRGEKIQSAPPSEGSDSGASEPQNISVEAFCGGFIPDDEARAAVARPPSAMAALPRRTVSFGQAVGEEELPPLRKARPSFILTDSQR